MQNKFLNLVENSLSRYSNGGFLVGDIVKLVANYKSKACYKDLNDTIKKFVDDLSKTDKSLRIVDIKTYYPSGAPGDNSNRGTCFNIDIATEFAPGSYDLQNKVTVPSDILEPANVYPSLAPIPDSLRKKERINMTPVKPEEDEEMPNNPYAQTLMSQDGEKLVRGDRALLNKNVKIPSNTVKGSNTVGTYTKMYMAS